MRKPNEVDPKLLMKKKIVKRGVELQLSRV